jgi:acetyl-CoA C-acetyltransferase
MKEVYIVSGARTPIGGLNGSLSSFTATQLGAKAIAEAVKRAGIDSAEVEVCYMGNVLSANLGQAPARQAAILGGLKDSTQCTTVNKVCASGSKAIIMAAQAIMLGDADVVVAGGMESMSNTPYYLDKARRGYTYGHSTLIDGVLKDGLWDVYNDYPMGMAAEKCAVDYNISREAQDEFAIMSYKRAATAWEAGKFDKEVFPLEIVDRKGTTIVSKDEDYTKVIFDKVPTLKPVFDKNGSVTAANASNINDGASALVLMSKEKADALGIKPLAKILSYGDFEKAPDEFTTAPDGAIRKALAKANLTLNDVDYFEINEAFAVVCLANQQLLGFDVNKLNVYGGGVALGHPIGNSGARIMVTLLSVLAQEGGKIGVIAICNGGGGASAIVIEKM